MVEEGLREGSLVDNDMARCSLHRSEALVFLALGDLDRAAIAAAETLALAERVGWMIGMGEGRWALACVASARGDAAGAVALLEPVVAGIEVHGVYEFGLAMSLPDAIEPLIVVGEVERAGRLSDALIEWGSVLIVPGRRRWAVGAGRWSWPNKVIWPEPRRLPWPLWPSTIGWTCRWRRSGR